MKLVELNEMKRRMFYLTYFKGEGGKFINFVTLRIPPKVGLPTRVSIYGTIRNNINGRRVLCDFIKHQDVKVFADEPEMVIFELDMSDYAMHITPETI